MTQRTAEMHPFLECPYYPTVTAQANPGEATTFLISIRNECGEQVEGAMANGRKALRDVLRTRMAHYRRIAREDAARGNY